MTRIRLRYGFTITLILFIVGDVAMGQNDSGSKAEHDKQQKANAIVESESTRQTDSSLEIPSLEKLKTSGALQSNYRKQETQAIAAEAPKSGLAEFRKKVEPILKNSCIECHGAETQEGNIRIDTLDPDLVHGDDVDWWLEVLAVLSNGEMPPADEAELADDDRSKVIEWLSSEIQYASTARRAEMGHSSFRRMTRYEYNYALQDLLGLPYNFTKDLPPDPTSDDGFQNSSEMLHMSTVQFGTYLASSRNALKRTTVRGERPDLIYWGVSMKAASAEAWSEQEKQLEKIREKHKDDPEKMKQALERKTAGFRVRPNNTHYKDLTTGLTARASWRYSGAKYAWKPTATQPVIPTSFDHVAIIPRKQKLIVELGDTIPDHGTLRVRIRASRAVVDDNRDPSLQLEFGWQASNDSAASVRISDRDITIDAAPDSPKFYQWDVPLSEIYPRNSVRNISKMGDLPSPSEFVKIVNSSVSQAGQSRDEVQIDYVEITAPVYEQWPPDSHTRIFADNANKADEAIYARELLTNFMSRAWRRSVTPKEVDQKLALFKNIRPACGDFEEAIVEVLATVLSSPKFLYLVQTKRDQNDPQPANSQHAHPQQPTSRNLGAEEIATRLSMFLWCSMPDEELLELAAKGQLSDSQVLAGQVERMLADPRSRRFSEQFVRQWLGMQLLDFFKANRKAYPRFDRALKEAMQEEPIAFFHELLQHNHSVIDFVHAQYTMANERLAKHYGLNDVYGNHFRRVEFEPNHRRGGLLTQAGLLAMNSDGKDSHPLKRGIWLLESLLNDPPPPPPPAVPEIDLTDPEIAKLTLKQRIEDHRNHAACLSCHAKIDPWGIAFENFDAIGSWRTQVQGKPVDASSVLFNGQELDGIDGLKRFLLKNRQDQFVRAMVHKMTTYALGRPLTFGDRSSVDQITADLRKQGDGLATMVNIIVASGVFRSM